MMTHDELRLTLAERLLDEYRNDYDGSDSAEEIAAATYAVCIQRSDDARVDACQTVRDVAFAYLGALTTDSIDVEYVERVVDMRTGADVPVQTVTTLTVSMPEGMASASTR